MRDQGVELLRFTAASFIVYWHMPGLPSGPWVSWSLTAFVAISILYGHRKRGVDAKEFRTRLGRRLLVPWFIWSAGYVVVRAVAHSADLADWFAEFDLLDLLVGGVLPLWYLPFMFVVLLGDSLLDSEATEEQRSKRQETYFIAGFFAIAVGSIMMATTFRSYPAPFPQYAAVLPASAGLLAGIRMVRLYGSWSAILLAGSLVGIAGLFQYDFFPSVFGVGLVLLLRGRWKGDSSRIAWMGRASWPVFLVHPFFIASVGLLDIVPTASFVVAWAASLAASWMILSRESLKDLLLEGRLRKRGSA